MPVRLKTPGGQGVVVEDNEVDYFTRLGYEPDTAFEDLRRDAAAAPVDDSLVGAANAAAGSFFSGATFGLSDVLFGGASVGEREDVAAERAAHPIASIGGEIAGAILPAFAAPGSLAAQLPAGRLGRVAAAGFERGLSAGGAEGLALAAGWSGLEGATQAAGSYLSGVALTDRELSAEGLSGALGMGFGFGAAGGGALYGIHKGAVSARKLFSEAVDGGDRALAEAREAWERARQETLASHDAAVEAARAKLARAKAGELPTAASAVPDEKLASVVAEYDDARAALAKVQQQSDELDALLSGKLEVDVAPNAPQGPYQRKAWPPEAPDAPGQLGARAERTMGTPVEPAPNQELLDALEAHARKTDATKVGRRPTSVVEEPPKPPIWHTDPKAYKNIRRVEQELEPEPAPAPWRTDPKAYKNAKLVEAPSRGEELTDLERQLMETKAKLDSGADLPDLALPIETGMEGIARMQRQVAAELPQETGLEAVLRMTRDRVSSGGTVENLDEILSASLTEAAKATTRLERAAADVAEALGDEAPIASREAAKAFRAAESEAERKLSDRTVRAIDDAAEPPSPKDLKASERKLLTAQRRERGAALKAQKLASEAKSRAREVGLVEPNTARARRAIERREAAQAKKIEADAALARVRAEVAKARQDAQQLRARAREAAKAEREAGKLSRAEARAQREARLAEGRDRRKVEAGIRSELRDATKARSEAVKGLPPKPEPPPVPEAVPGMPVLNSIPVVGPILSSFLNYTAMKTAFGRAGAKVPGSAMSRAAALVSGVKNKIAVAVDKSLGLVAKSTEKTGVPFAAATGVLSQRAFDDDEPDAPKGATVPQLAAVRIREIAHAATNPHAVAAEVRRELRDVEDPDLIEAAEKHRIALYDYLNREAPKGPPENPYSKRKWEPSVAASMQFARRLEVANDPVAAFEALHQRSLTPEAAQTLREVYPRLFLLAQSRLLDRAGDMTDPVSYEQRIRNSFLFQIPLDDSLDPDSMRILASAHAPSEAQPQPQQSQLPAASIAAPVDLTSLYQTTSDRRAMR